MDILIEILKAVLLFAGVLSLVLTIEQLYLTQLVVKNKGKVNDTGMSRLILAAVFSVSVALLVILW